MCGTPIMKTALKRLLTVVIGPPETTYGRQQGVQVSNAALIFYILTIFGYCTMNNCESEEIVEAANIAISNLLPTKSRSLYDIAYNRFKKWCAEKKCSSIQRECFVGILQ
ncbi:hypothetical protein NQ317_004230 [Molorchus minor]|uniref:Uncharacterized protein n=1 Tax=Molorchus minor TaxID=1323400 RepID=A0ABQ9JZR2_9CUCU|nr:hypothetical protein NQ317_004230 [Molorchus minor]